MLRRFSAEASRVCTAILNVLNVGWETAEGELQCAAKIQKAAWQRRQPFVQGRIILTEFKTVKAFWRNLMSRQSGVSRFFSRITALFFNYLQIM